MSNYFKILPKARSKNPLFFLNNLSLTTNLIVVTVLCFILFWLFRILLINTLGLDMINYFAVQANNLFLHGYIWTPITSIFMHANIWHLLFNMFTLYFLGSFAEMIIGRKRFFWFYIISGIFAALFFAVLSFFFGNGPLGIRIFGSAETFAVGASGALFAIAGLLAVLTPKNRVSLLAGPLIAIIIEAIAMNLFSNPTVISVIDWIVTFYIIASLFTIMFNPFSKKIALPIEMPFWLLPFTAIIPLIIIGLFVNLPIGNTAHLGGFLFGALDGFYLKYRYKNKTKMIAEYFSKR